jgi:hypothetical protein
MKIVFKVIAIIGILSFFGALKDGVFFFIGLVLALVFGYLGWKPKKKYTNLNYSNNTSTSSNFQAQPINFDQNSNNTDEKLKYINQKIELLNSSFSKGILNQKEFTKKLSKLEIEKGQLLKIINAKDTLQAIMTENKTVFDELLELKESGLISNEEYLMKKSKLIDSYKIEKGIEIIKGQDSDLNRREVLLTFLFILVGFGLFYLIMLYSTDKI